MTKWRSGSSEFRLDFRRSFVHVWSTFLPEKEGSPLPNSGGLAIERTLRETKEQSISIPSLMNSSGIPMVQISRKIRRKETLNRYIFYTYFAKFCRFSGHVVLQGRPEHGTGNTGIRNTGTLEHGTRNTGTPEHRNTGTPEHHGTFRNTHKNRNTPKIPEHPQKTRNTPKNPEHSPKNRSTPPPRKKKETREISKSRSVVRQ